MKVYGAVILVLAVLIAAVPQFTTCDYQGKQISLPNGKTVPMKCLWTARAELAAGVPLAAVGLLALFSRRSGERRSLAIIGAILGGAILAFPAWLIGVCSSNMLCNTLMRPVLLAMGGTVVVASLAALALVQKGNSGDRGA